MLIALICVLALVVIFGLRAVAILLVWTVAFVFGSVMLLVGLITG